MATTLGCVARSPSRSIDPGVQVAASCGSSGSGANDKTVAGGSDFGTLKDVCHPAKTPNKDNSDRGVTAKSIRITSMSDAGSTIRTGLNLMNVDSDVVPVGSAASAKHLTVLVWPGAKDSAFALHDEDDALTQIAAHADAAVRTVSIDRTLRPTLVRIRSDAAPSAVEVDGAALAAASDFAALAGASSGYWYEAATRSTWIALPANASAQSIVVHVP